MRFKNLLFAISLTTWTVTGLCTSAFALEVDFFAGGSIMGNTFKVHISDERMTYREYETGDPFGRGAETRKVDRVLSPAELKDIHTTILNAGLLDVPSQDLDSLPPDDAGHYQIFLSVDGKDNTIKCGIPSSPEEPLSVCQERIEKLKAKLNELLQVNIY